MRGRVEHRIHAAWTNAGRSPCIAHRSAKQGCTTYGCVSSNQANARPSSRKNTKLGVLKTPVPIVGSTFMQRKLLASSERACRRKEATARSCSEPKSLEIFEPWLHAPGGSSDMAPADASHMPERLKRTPMGKPLGRAVVIMQGRTTRSCSAAPWAPQAPAPSGLSASALAEPWPFSAARSREHLATRPWHKRCIDVVRRRDSV